MFEINGIELPLSEKLAKRVLTHKQTFIELFTGRYKEILPTLIRYKNKSSVSIDFLKLEVALNSDYDVVIGENTKGRIVILGYMFTQKSQNNPTDIFESEKLTKKDIHFIIEDKFIPNKMQEISYDDGCESGNFVVIRNKVHNYVSDVSIIEHYVSELAEIVLSRYSLSMQAKIITFFIDNLDGESMNTVIEYLYNGVPFVKVSDLFDPVDSIVNVQGAGNVGTNLEAMKKEYQHKISELNNMLGINSLAVDKESGVSDSEANSNRSFTTSNANIKLVSRNHALHLLNKRYGLKLEAVYNDEVESEESIKNEENSNDNGSHSIGITEKGNE